jgi:hypothetical protein
MHWFWRGTLAAGIIGVVFGLLFGRNYLKDFIGLGTAAFLLSALPLITYGLLTVFIPHGRSHSDTPETRCRNCGYILRGITEPRCPECGERI